MSHFTKSIIAAIAAMLVVLIALYFGNLTFYLILAVGILVFIVCLRANPKYWYRRIAEICFGIGASHALLPAFDGVFVFERKGLFVGGSFLEKVNIWGFFGFGVVFASFDFFLMAISSWEGRKQSYTTNTSTSGSSSPVLNAARDAIYNGTTTNEMPPDFLDKYEGLVKEREELLRQNDSLSKPSAIKVILDKTIKEIENTDPRVRAEYDTPRIRVIPKENITGKISLVGKEKNVREAMRSLEFGGSISRDIHDVEIIGEGIPGQPGIASIESLKVSMKLPGTIRFSRLDQSKNEIGSFEVDGEVTGTKSVAEFSASVPSKVFSTSFPIARSGTGEMHFKLNIEKWAGCALTRLPDFDRIQRVFTLTEPKMTIRVDLDVAGLKTASGELNASDNEFVQNLCAVMFWLSRAREVSDSVGCEIVLPKNLPDSWVDEIDWLSQLILDGEEVLFDPTVAEIRALRNSNQKTEADLHVGSIVEFASIDTNRDFELFGQKFCFGPISVSCAECEVLEVGVVDEQNEELLAIKLKPKTAWKLKRVDHEITDIP